MLPACGGIVVEVSGDKVVPDDVRGFGEPEFGYLGKHPPLLRYRVGKHDVESGYPVRGDDEQRFAEIIDIAHLAAFGRLQSARLVSRINDVFITIAPFLFGAY